MADQPKSTPVLLNPPPKTRFQQSPDNITKHRAMVDSREFERGCDFALLQYQAYLSQQQVDFQGAAANNFKMLGAQEFIQVLRMLAEKPQLPKVVQPDNLDHTN